MATAEQLLAEVTEVDKKLYIDFDTRQILIPDCIHQLGVESDDDVKKLTFNVPRYYYGTDLSEFNIYINYMNAKKEGDVFEVPKNDVIIDEGNTLTFDWIVGRHAVAYKGTAIFNVCMKKGSMQPDPGDATQEIFVVDQEFNTTVAKLPVLEGLETSGEVVQEYADILMQWEEELFGIENSATSNITQKGSEVIGAVNTAGEEQRSQIALKGSEVLSEVANVKNEVTAEGETQKTAITQKGSEVIDAVNTAGEEQKAAIASKGSEVINTVGGQLDIKIPEYIEAHPDQFKGDKGDPGQDGISPTLSENKVGKVTTVTVTDGNGTHTFDINDGADGKDGTSITILGSYSTEAELIAAHPTGNKGDGYLVAGDLYVWDVITSTWKNVGTIQGPAGKDGVDGQDGYTPVKGVDYFDGTDGVSPTVSISKVGKVTTITITDATGPHTATINDGVDGTGAGDMLMATYDTDGDGVVDNAAQLGGVAADQYALKTDVPDKAADSYKLGGVAASEYALKTDILDKAADSDKLGGVAASEYALKTDTAPDSTKLGGVAANQYALKTDITTPTMSITDDGNGNVILSIGG